jgi:hypothetical protein
MVEKVSIKKAATTTELKTINAGTKIIKNPPDGDRIPVAPIQPPHDPIIPKDNPFGGKSPLKDVVRDKNMGRR